MTRTKVVKRLIALSLLLLLSINLHISAKECSPWVAKAISIQGNVEKRSFSNKKSSEWLPIKRDDELCAGEIVRVKQNSRAALILRNDTILRLNQNTTMTLSGFSDEQSNWINLEKGIAHFIARIKQSFKVITPFVNAAVEGTEFVISVNSTQSEVTVFEGIVRAKNKLGEITLTGGQTAIATKTTPPTVIIKINPRNAVQWSLYYPAIINYKNIQFDNDEYNYKNKSIIEKSVIEAQKGNIVNAIALIDLIETTPKNTALQIYKATLYLSVGRTSLSQEIILSTLKIQAHNPQAIALQSIIATVQNNKIKALKLAKQASSIAPSAYQPAMALSYAYQSMFDIDSALSTIQSSIKKNNDNALLWTRLSELNLMKGNLDNALISAKKAMILNPKLSKTQTTLGFAYLSQVKINQAKKSFKKAINIDDTDPLSHLGLGLAIIHLGKLSLGRQHIEFAATLDPNNALIRSYLGKAYYEEKREQLATTQFDMAKNLDPLDPTAYFYSAIQKQSLNRPVEALFDLDKSIELNNNRAIYRSSFLLDQDEAARSVSLARIYSDIGFDDLALREGWKSTINDPTNNSAHRFLADSYSNLPKQDIARVSELLQAQLLQALNLNPIQPQLAFSNLGILNGTGPSESAFSEYNQMFTRNNINFQLNAILGAQNTIGNDFVISGLKNLVSYSFGQFYYKTKGYRPNNDLTHDIYNAFIQFQATTNFNIQFENRIRKTASGDLQQTFDLNNYKENKRRDIKTETNRFGFKYKSTIDQTLIASFINNERTITESDFSIIPGPPFDVKNTETANNDLSGKSREVQYIYNPSFIKMIFGFSNINLKHTEDRNLIQSILPPGPSATTSNPSSLNKDAIYSTAYLYFNITSFENALVTLGFSYDDYKIVKYKNKKLNPKLGIQYKFNPNTLLRVAALSSVKRPITTNQTIEPTNILGFNQFYDDLRGAEITSYGVALDHTFSKYIKASISPGWRSLNVPVFINSNSDSFDHYDEQTVNSFISYIINKHLSFSIKYNTELLERSASNVDSSQPLKLRTSQIPISLNYSNPNGISFYMSSINIDQVYKDNISITQSENFWTTNFSLSYRLSKRAGILSLGINNIFDQNFNFYGVNFTGEPKLAQYLPERSVNIRINTTF